MARTYQFLIGAAEAGRRLDHYLARHLPQEISRSMIQRRVRDGAITVGERAAKAHQKLHEGDVVRAHFEHLPAPSSGVELIPQQIPLDILYEDDQLLVVNKPPGLVTHPAPGHWDGTLVNALVWYFAEASGSKPQAARGSLQPAACSLQPVLPRAGIVHRLDKETSGLLLVAKTETAHAALSKQLKARLVKRRYLALVEGHVPLHEGTVDAAIGRHLTHRKVMAVRHLGGRSAVTHYRVMKRFGVRGERRGASVDPLEPNVLSEIPHTLLEVSLETGRTHQIRVHMAHLGYPVLGDTTYGRHPVGYWQALGIERQLLHAYAIRFTHPTTRQPIALTAPIPEDLQRWIGDATNRDVSAKKLDR